MVEIYYSSRCPFCIKVVKAVEKMGLVEGEDYRLIDAAPGTAGRQTVIDIGGRAMVPFLVDGAVSMYESDDIIAYLRTRFS